MGSVVIAHPSSFQNNKMKVYIQSAATISPYDHHAIQVSAGINSQDNRLRCIEPDYKALIDPKLLRRMSRIIRMGTAAALQSLSEANIEIPDAIITGTAYGCLEDTGTFLGKMIEQNEELLTPTAFIQSTHNTVAAQIALLLGAHGYNNTFVHRGISFESALMDAIMLLNNGDAATVLVGGLDELTDKSFEVLNRFSLFEKTPAGEGASFFALTNSKDQRSIASIESLATYYKPSVESLKQLIQNFLHQNNLTTEDVDVLYNGGPTSDPYYCVTQHMFEERVTNFKAHCGEYPTATAFAMWFACHNNEAKQRILIYNHFHGIHHSLILLTKC